ncbi:MAG: WhiB family transcriptional regulator [Demequinaceae bacterium]|nr:WhiB family transcriptional regulator [Demequinaceae bacterium]
MTDSIVKERRPALEEWEWQYSGLCRQADPNLFFHPENERGFARQRRAEAAKRYCARCPVREHCRQHALSVREPFGVWGGLSEDERNAILEGRILRRR